MPNIYIITGGTMVHIRPHFALCAPAYGQVGHQIADLLRQRLATHPLLAPWRVVLIPTKMAGLASEEVSQQLAALGIPALPETNGDVQALVHTLLADPTTSCLVMAAAICDFEPVLMQVNDAQGESIPTEAFGKDQPRLHHAESVTLTLSPSEKILGAIKPHRPDVTLISFKTTAGRTQQEMVRQALENAQKTRSDLVFANDVQTHQNLVVQLDGQYQVGATRQEALGWLCDGIIAHLAALQSGERTE